MADDKKFSSTTANIETKSQEKSTTKPGSLEKIDGTENEITLRWTAPMNKNKTITHYEVKYRAANGKWTPLFTEGEETIISVKNLDNNTEYEFKTKAVYEDDEGPFCKSLKVFTEKQKLDINQAGIPIETSSTDTSISLQWDIPRETEGTIDYYEVRYKESHNSQNRWQTIQTSKDENNITVSGLLAQTSYTFKVCAVLDDEEGPYSLCSTISTPGSCEDQMLLVNDVTYASNVLLEPKTQNEQTRIDSESYDDCTETFFDCSESYYECSESDYVDDSEYLSNVKSQEDCDMKIPPSNETSSQKKSSELQVSEMTFQSLVLANYEEGHVSEPNVTILKDTSTDEPNKVNEMNNACLVPSTKGHTSEPNVTIHKDNSAKKPILGTTKEMNNSSQGPSTEEQHGDPNVNIHKDPLAKKPPEVTANEMNNSSLVLPKEEYISDPNITIHNDPSAKKPIQANEMNNNSSLVPSTQGTDSDPDVTIHKDLSAKRPSQVTANEMNNSSLVPSTEKPDSDPNVTIHKDLSAKKPSQVTVNERNNSSLVLSTEEPDSDPNVTIHKDLSAKKPSQVTTNERINPSLVPSTEEPDSASNVTIHKDLSAKKPSQVTANERNNPSLALSTEEPDSDPNVTIHKDLSAKKPSQVTANERNNPSLVLSTEEPDSEPNVTIHKCPSTKTPIQITENEMKNSSLVPSTLGTDSDPTVTIHKDPLAKKRSQVTANEMNNSSLVPSTEEPDSDPNVTIHKDSLAKKPSQVTANERNHSSLVPSTDGPDSDPNRIIHEDPSSKKPSQLTAKEIADRSLVIAWTYSDDDELHEYFDIRYREKNSTKWKKIISQDNSATIIDLLPGTVYEVKVRALYDNGFGDFCDTSTMSTTTEEQHSVKGQISTVKELQNELVSKLCAPGKPVAANVSSTTVSLKWDSTSLNTRDIHYHEIRYKECYDDKMGWKLYQTHSATNQITIPNLKSMTAYEFKVKTVLLSTEVTPLSVASDPITTAAFIIDNIDKTGQSHDSIAIRWDRPNYDDDIVKYKVAFKKESAKEWNTVFTKGRENQIVISELSENTEYEVKVIAVTNRGQGSESNVLTKFRTVQKPRKNYPVNPHKKDVSSRSVTLKWQQCELRRFECYEIRYRECASPPAKWTSISTRVKLDKFTITDLKCETFYEFKVAAVVDGEADKFSEVSPQICTSSSLARNIVSTTKNLSLIYKGHPKRYKLPVKMMSSDASAKTRKMELDVEILTDEEKTQSSAQQFIRWFKKKAAKTVRPFMMPSNEKNIILVGATGSGKSTLIDGMINYIADASWDDDVRFSLIDETQDEKQRSKDQTISQTEWITTYQIPNFPGSPLKYTLNIIDTPGFGDTRGIERDKKIISQIDKLFQTVGENGIQTIHGVCFVTQSPLARLTPTAKYIFDSILAIFGKDIAENINVLITFADGKTPPVLDALTKANVPFTSSFKFNNSALFEPNDDSTKDSFAKMFWKMGEESFKRFFDHLETVEPKSLQLTNDVLRTRETLETTIIGFQKQVLDGMSQLNTIRQEGTILKQHRTDIEANKDFTYTVDDVVMVEIHLEPGEHVTNCMHCNMTCHFPCYLADNENKEYCAAMKDGFCTVCPVNCSWNTHKNAQFRIEPETRKVTKTFEQLKVKYEVATKEAQNRRVVLIKMKEKFVKIRTDVSGMITQIRKCLNKLDESALKSNPLSSIQYIDLLIHSEETEMKDGFQGRIALLESFRKDAEIIEKAKTGDLVMFDDVDQILKEFDINEGE